MAEAKGDVRFNFWSTGKEATAVTHLYKMPKLVDEFISLHDLASISKLDNMPTPEEPRPESNMVC